MSRLRVIKNTDISPHLPPADYIEVDKETRQTMYSATAKAIRLQAALCGRYSTPGQLEQARVDLRAMIGELAAVLEGLG